MLKIVKNLSKEAEFWKLAIGNEVVESASFHKDLFTLVLTVSLTETSPIFFEREFHEFYSLFSNEMELPAEFESLRLKISLADFLEDESAELFRVDGDDDSGMSPSFIVEFEREQEEDLIFGELDNFVFMFNPTWRYPFSILEYYELISECLEAIKQEKFYYFVGKLQFSLPNNLTLGSFLQSFIERVRIAHRKAFEELLNKTEATSLTGRFFGFPEEIRIPCEQYLLFFCGIFKRFRN